MGTNFIMPRLWIRIKLWWKARRHKGKLIPGNKLKEYCLIVIELNETPGRTWDVIAKFNDLCDEEVIKDCKNQEEYWEARTNFFTRYIRSKRLKDLWYSRKGYYSIHLDRETQDLKIYLEPTDNTNTISTRHLSNSKTFRYIKNVAAKKEKEI